MCIPFTQAEQPSPWLVYAVETLILIGLVVALGAIRRALAVPGSTWSLPDALSEEVTLPLLDIGGSPVLQGTSVVTTPRLVASTSRLIALMGMLAILALFIGFGVFVLRDFATTGCMPSSTSEIVQFLLAGLTLFAPYAVNKVAASISGR